MCRPTKQCRSFMERFTKKDYELDSLRVMEEALARHLK